MAPPPPPGLMDDIIGEILLHIPPEDPEYLVRASVVCKRWRRLLSDPGFLRRYSEFHRSPPLLGFFHTEFHNELSYPRFIAIKEATPIPKPRPEPGCFIVDCRHGRVLLFTQQTGLIVWDPITGTRQHIGQPKIKGRLHRFTAAVICAVDGCEHLGCRGGSSLVVFVQIRIPIQGYYRGSASASVYSTETGAWNDRVSSSVQFGLAILGLNNVIGSSLLAGDALYFMVEEGRRIIKYDLAGCGLSLMRPPSMPVGNIVLMRAEGGGLGACGVEGHSLHLWAWRTGAGGTSEWLRGRVIHLDIGDISKKLYLVDFAEGAGSIFLRASTGVFAVELKSGRARKIAKGVDFVDIFPFMSFYTPGATLVRSDLFPQS